MGHEKDAEGAGLREGADPEKRHPNLWSIWILSVLYLFSPVIVGGCAYNLIAAGVLIGSSSIVCFKPIQWSRKIARYAFVVGLVMGVVGVSPPIYFAVAYGLEAVWLFSPIELALSIACIALTIIAILKIRSLGIFQAIHTQDQKS